MRSDVTTMIAAIVAPASGIRSRIATSRPSATAYGTPRASRVMVGDDSGDQADQEVPGDVAADCTVDLISDAAQRYPGEQQAVDAPSRPGLRGA